MTAVVSSARAAMAQSSAESTPPLRKAAGRAAAGQPRLHAALQVRVERVHGGVEAHGAGPCRFGFSWDSGIEAVRPTSASSLTGLHGEHVLEQRVRRGDVQKRRYSCSERRAMPSLRTAQAQQRVQMGGEGNLPAAAGVEVEVAQARRVAVEHQAIAVPHRQREHAVQARQQGRRPPLPTRQHDLRQGQAFRDSELPVKVSLVEDLAVNGQSKAGVRRAGLVPSAGGQGRRRCQGELDSIGGLLALAPPTPSP